MPKFAFTVILTDAEQRPYEYSNLLDAACVEHAILMLSSKGYIVREIRAANAEDLRLYKLKKFRDKLIKGLKWRGKDESR